MSIFEQTSDNWRKTRGNFAHWHRNDFVDAMMLEMTGSGAQMGACGDFMPAEANFKRNATNAQMQQLANGSLVSATRLRGIPIGTTPPLNEQVLVYDAATKTYIPTTISTGSGKIILGGTGNITTSAGIVFVSLNCAVTNTLEPPTFFYSPVAGTLRNLRVFTVNNPLNNGQLVLRVNQTDTAISVLIPAPTSDFLTTDLVHTATVNIGDIITFRTNNTSSGALNLGMISIEMDVA